MMPPRSTGWHGRVAAGFAAVPAASFAMVPAAGFAVVRAASFAMVPAAGFAVVRAAGLAVMPVVGRGGVAHGLRAGRWYGADSRLTVGY